MQSGRKIKPLPAPYKNCHSGIEPGLYPDGFIDTVREAFLKTDVTRRYEDGDYIIKQGLAENSRWKSIEIENGLKRIKKIFRKAHDKGGKVMFIGNGGSAAIASHMAADYSKNAKIRSVAFSDSATLTCVANDFGHENIFAKQIEFYALENDVVVCISSSGKSVNITEAASQAHSMGLYLVTFSGMDSNNPLRKMGDINFHVPTMDYGLIEITHLILLHTITSLDLL